MTETETVQEASVAETLVVVSKIKKLVKDQGFRTGGDYIEGLSKKVESIIGESLNKIKADGKRKTLGQEDL